MKGTDIHALIPTLLTTPLLMLVAGLLAASSCGSNGLRTPTTHDAGVASGSGGVIGTGGNRPSPGSGGSGGFSSTQGSTSNHTLGVNQCRWSADCDVRQGATCVPPGGATPCGVCLWVPSPCTSDRDCLGDGASAICEVAVGCVCPIGTKICSPGCSDASDCGTGEACAGRHCVPTPCQNDADCPTDFSCTSGSCGRKACVIDSDCSGYCVTGGCYSTPGTCYGAVA
jgi:hypothetical protein